MNNKLQKKDYIYVGIQLLLFAAYVIPVTLIPIEIPDWLRYSGIVLLILGGLLGTIALLQLNTKLSPFPTPVDSGKIITSGAFAFARHPIYTAILIAAIGYALYCESFYKILIFFLLFILFYFKSNYEEQLLKKSYPSYASYQLKVGKFLSVYKLKF